MYRMLRKNGINTFFPEHPSCMYFNWKFISEKNLKLCFCGLTLFNQWLKNRTSFFPWHLWNKKWLKWCERKWKQFIDADWDRSCNIIQCWLSALRVVRVRVRHGGDNWAIGRRRYVDMLFLAALILGGKLPFLVDGWFLLNPTSSPTSSVRPLPSYFPHFLAPHMLVYLYLHIAKLLWPNKFWALHSC